jgi:hypothetical protein
MQTDLSKHFIIKAFILIWAILCVLLFLLSSGKVTYVQWSNLAEWQLLPGKLDRLDPARDLANLLLALAGVSIFSGACISLGRFVARQAKFGTMLNSATALTRLAFLATEFLIGHGLFSIFFLMLGLLYQLTPLSVMLILVAGFAIGFWPIGNNFSRAYGEVKSMLKELPAAKSDKLVVWLLASILLFSLLYSTARISYDSSAVYFSDAKLSAMSHQVQFFTEDSFVASLFQNVIQFAALIQLFGDQSARLLSWIFGVAVLIFSLALAERLGLSRPGRLILATFLLTSTAFLDLLGDGKVDILSTAPALATIYWMVIESQEKTLNRSLLLWVGLLSGLAIVGRPFNAILLGIFILLFYLQRTYRKGGFEHLSHISLLRSFFWLGIGILGFGIYHLFANWILLGDPLAFLSNASKVNPSAGPWDYRSDQIMAIRLFYPFVATFYNSPYTLGNISPLFLGFLPMLLLPGIRKSVMLTQQGRSLTLISTVTLVLWIFFFFTVYEIRYVLFLWIIIFMPVAEIGAVVLDNKDRILRQISSALMIALLVFISVRAVYISLDTYSPIDAQGNPQCFCESLTPINNSASTGDRVLTLSAYRYYLRNDLFACSTKHDEYKKLQAAARNGSEAFWLEVYRQGYKFIAYEKEYTSKHLQMGILPGPGNAPGWLELDQIYSSPRGEHAAYRINVKTPPGPTDTACSLNASGVWEVRAAE